MAVSIPLNIYKPGKTRIHEMADTLFLRPLLGSIPMPDGTELHKNLFDLPVHPLGRCCHPVHIFSRDGTQHILMRKCGRMVAFVHNHHSVIPNH